MLTSSKRLVLFNPLIITMNKDFEILKGDIFIEDGRIKIIGKIDPREWTKRGSYEIIYASDKIALPGLIQTHTHICQTLFRGLADNLCLLDWLQKKIFPLESAHNEKSMRASARLGLTELVKSGTTTILDMGSVHFQDAIFDEAKSFGMRYIGGKSLMDSGNNVFAEIKGIVRKQSKELQEVSEQIEKWHNKEDGRLKYALSPRFILSCSIPFLKEISELAEEKKLIIHTHCAENSEEENLVKKQNGKSSICNN